MQLNSKMQISSNFLLFGQRYKKVQLRITGFWGRFVVGTFNKRRTNEIGEISVETLHIGDKCVEEQYEWQ